MIREPFVPTAHRRQRRQHWINVAQFVAVCLVGILGLYAVVSAVLSIGGGQ